MSVQYLSLMKELGESVPDAPGGGTAVPPPASLVRTQQYTVDPPIKDPPRKGQPFIKDTL